MAHFTEDTHWRDSARSARFFIIDARAAFPLVLFLMHIRLWTFILACIAMTFFALLERFGFHLHIFFRWFRAMLAGPHKSAHPWWRS